MVKSGEIQFELDSITSDIFTASQWIPELNAYSFLSHNKEILVYDYDSRELINKIPVKTPQPTSYQYIGTDSILLLDYQSRMLLLSDTKGDNIRKFSINPTIEYFPLPIVKISPIVMKNQNIYFWGSMAGEYIDENDENRMVLTSVGTAIPTTSYYMPYPDIYKNNWAGRLFRWVYGEYNSNSDVFIFSFPADHNIYVLDGKLMKTDSYYCGSELIDVIRYLKSSKSRPVTSDEAIRFFAENNSYSRIIYDSYNDVYYRFAELKTEYNGVPGWKKDVSIIILDNEFEVIGETFIGQLASNCKYSIFVNHEGLHLLSIDNNEDILTFDVYKLSKK